MYLRYFKGIQVIKALNFIPYIKSDAVQLLKLKYDYESFENKHAESYFTKFYEGYWLPTRFGFDTRRLTYSSLIVTNQMSRKDAINFLNKSALSKLEIKTESDFIAKKLRISPKELEKYRDMPLKTYKDYKNISYIFKFGAILFKLMKGDTSGVRR